MTTKIQSSKVEVKCIHISIGNREWLIQESFGYLEEHGLLADSRCGQRSDENGQCLARGVPQAIAPDLVGWTAQQSPHCVWKNRPKTRAEIERAIAVLDAQELGCHRYAETDAGILERVLSTYCDYPVRPPASAGSAEFRLSKFALLNDKPTLITRLWRTIIRRNRLDNE